MSKVLLLNASLERIQKDISPLMSHLYVYLKGASVVDLRDAQNFDERTFFEYNSVIFLYAIASDCTPSVLLDVLEKLERVDKHIDVYQVIACFEYETDKCDLSERIIEAWCKRQDIRYCGSLKIGSLLKANQSTLKLRIAHYLKVFAQDVLKHREGYYAVTMHSKNVYLKHMNAYWSKEIRKRKNRKK